MGVQVRLLSKGLIRGMLLRLSAKGTKAQQHKAKGAKAQQHTSKRATNIKVMFLAFNQKNRGQYPGSP